MATSHGTRAGIAVLAFGLVVSATVGSAHGQNPPTTIPTADEHGQVEALQGRSDGEVTIDRDPVTHAITFVGTEPGRPLETPQESTGDPAAAAGDFVSDFGAMFGAANPSDLERQQIDPRVDGGANVVYHQVVGGVPVVGGELRVQVDEHGDVLSAIGELAPGIAVETTSRIDAVAATDEAVATVAKAHVVDPSSLTASVPERWVYAPDLLGQAAFGAPRLVWRIEVTGPGEREPINELVLVDASTGTIALHFNQAATAIDRTVCDNGNLPAADPACLGPFAVRTEGQASTGDSDVDNAYDYAGDTYDFYLSRFGRDSLDDHGLPLLSTVRYCPQDAPCPLHNASWNGSQMVYGDGFANADDVVGHELTHGVTHFSSGLFYYFQSGAINESLSDVFGEFVDLTNGAGNDAPSARWLIGEDLSDGAVRNMANPPADGGPERMGSALYSNGATDFGGVHTNSGVSNKAAFLMTDGGTFNGHTVPALGLFKAARIYYEAATTLLGSASDYADLGRGLVQACINVIGTDGITPTNCAAVQQAVDAVEMSTDPANAPTGDSPGCDAGTTAVTVFADDLEDPSLGRWAVTGTAGLRWAYPQNPNPYSDLDATWATSGTRNLFAADTVHPSDTSIARTADVVLPAGSILVFNHAYQYDIGDGGTVEYSTNGGATWTDAGSLFTSGGYNGSLHDDTSGFSSTSFGYRSSRIDLSSLAGQSFRFRFRSTTDDGGGSYGWFVDDIRILSCLAPNVGRPDARIRLGAAGPDAGADIYNTSGAGQSRSTTVGDLGVATFYARIQNDGSEAEPITLNGSATSEPFKVQYFAGPTNITTQVTAGTYTTATLAPGQTAKIKVVVGARRGAPVGSVTNVRVSATSSSTPANRDTVKAKVTRNH